MTQTTQGASSTYRQRISLSKEEKDQKGIDSKVRRAVIHADSDILRTEEALAEATERLERAESADPFNLQSVINAEVEVENITEVLERANGIKARLFPAS
jgi:hypothetical protein